MLPGSGDLGPGAWVCYTLLPCYKVDVTHHGPVLSPSSCQKRGVTGTKVVANVSVTMMLCKAEQSIQDQDQQVVFLGLRGLKGS